MNGDRQLSPAEIRVLRLVVKGMGNKGIAHKLKVSPSTVKNQLTNIYQKCHVPEKFNPRLWVAQNAYRILKDYEGDGNHKGNKILFTIQNLYSKLKIG